MRGEENEVPAEMIGLCAESCHVILFGYRLPNTLLRFLRSERQTESIPYVERTRRRCSCILIDFDGWLVMWLIGWELNCRLYEYPHCRYWRIRAIRGVSSWQPMKSIGICTSCNRHVPHHGVRSITQSGKVWPTRTIVSLITGTVRERIQ